LMNNEKYIDKYERTLMHSMHELLTDENVFNNTLQSVIKDYAELVFYNRGIKDTIKDVEVLEARSKVRYFIDNDDGFVLKFFGDIKIA
jgi:hypothetical protein